MNDSTRNPSRRDAIRTGLAAGMGLALGRLPLHAAESAHRTAQRPLVTKPIPSSGEQIPVIGLGTAQSWGQTPTDRLVELIRRMPELGGKVIDTAPSYGQSETVLGDVVARVGNRDRLFLATKVSVGGRGGGTPDPARGIASLEESMRRFKSDRIDLMQVWNLGGPDILLPILREWKQAGKIRYIGVTTSSDRQYPQLVELMKKETLDFVQVDYSVANRNAAEEVLPFAAERGMATLINLPFGRESIFRAVEGKAVPDWAKEIDCTTWAQLALKYVVSHPAVTCAIPGTTNPDHLAENLVAAHGPMPDAAMRSRIETAFAGD
jgi:aryl-alcohol dehydrogenase-like predicted oxidoreductase